MSQETSFMTSTDTQESTLEFLKLLDLYPVEPDEPQIQKKKKSSLVCDINLEFGMPSVKDALFRMEQEVKVAKWNGYSIARLIHGYGSTGRGGAIRNAVRQKTKNIIPGEEFDIFNPTLRKLLDRFPELKKDQDFGKCNQGITMLILRGNA